MGASNNDHITVKAELASKLADLLNDSDIPIGEAITGDKYSNSVKAFEGDKNAPEYDNNGDCYADDRTITVHELVSAFRKNQYGAAKQLAKRAAEFVMSKAVGELGNEIDSEAECNRFVAILTGDDAHLISGGAIVYDRINDPNDKRVTIKLFAPDLTVQQLRQQMFPYNVPSFLRDVDVSFEIPTEDPAKHYFLTDVNFMGFRWPSLTLNKFPAGQSDEYFKTDWNMIEPSKAKEILRKPENVERLKSAMNRAGMDTSGTKVASFLETIIQNLGDTYYVKGFSEKKESVYTYEQASKASLNPPTNTPPIEAALKTALHNSMDPRERTKPKMQVIIYKTGKRENLTREAATFSPRK